MKKLLTVFAIALVLTLSIACVALAGGASEGDVIAWGDRYTITEIAGHAVDAAALKIWKEPTCTERGVAHYPCKVEGDGAYHTLYIAPLGHDWASLHTNPPYDPSMEWGNILVPATCTEEGLAIDVCLRCHEVNPEKTRIIKKVAHVYSPTTLTEATAIEKDYPEGKCKWIGYFKEEGKAKYQIITKPSCAKEGDAWRVCLVCGHVDTTYKVSLGKTAHTWSDWKVKEAATCWAEGYVIRACYKCGATEKLTETNDLDKDGKPTNWIKLVQKRNIKWDDTMAPITAGLVSADLVKEEVWLTTCYTYNNVYICPFCKCDPKNYPIGFPAEKMHHKVKDYNLDLISHRWLAKPEAVKDCPVPINKAEYNKDADKAREEWAYANAASVAPTCIYDGFDVYKCEYDGKETSDWEKVHADEDVHTRYKVVRVPALGHNWTEWELHETFELDGQPVYQYIRICKRCGANETNISKGEDPDENVLVSSITIKAKLTLKVGQKKTLTAKVQPAVATNKNVKWTSSNKKIATVSSKGVVKGKKAGTCIITCKALDGSGIEAMCKVTVKKK